MKRITLIFSLAFILNVVWENLHSYLYASYKGGDITEFILLRAALFDAFLITLITLPFLYVSLFRKKSWLIFLLGTIVAIGNEWYGLSTGRWEYNTYMPIVPLLKIGLTPMLQLGILGLLSFLVQEKWIAKRPVVHSKT